MLQVGSFDLRVSPLRLIAAVGKIYTRELCNISNHLLRVIMQFEQQYKRSSFPIPYNMLAQLRKLEGPNYQHKCAAGRKVYMEEITERQLLIRGRAFATFFTIEKALAGHKKSFRGPYVVQACRIRLIYNFIPGR